MTSTYDVLCLTHEPATYVGTYGQAGDAVSEIRAGVKGHSRCDLVVGHMVGEYVEFGCPPNLVDQVGRPSCSVHPETSWVEAHVLHLLAVARESGDETVRRAADVPGFWLCWTPRRLALLRRALQADRVEMRAVEAVSKAS